MKHKPTIEGILKIAEQMERNGVAFYQTAAERFQGEQQERLQGLAAMERVHEQLFAAMRRNADSSLENLKENDPYPLGLDFLSDTGIGQIFNLQNQPTEILCGSESLEDILRTAIDLEKDSVVFYVAIKDVYEEHEGKHIIGKIIKEEMGHIAILSRALEELTR